MPISLSRDLTTGKVGLLVAVDSKHDLVIVNPNHFQPVPGISFFFTLDPKVVEDFISRMNFKDVRGGEVIDVTSYGKFRAQIDDVLGTFVPPRNSVEFNTLYESIKRYSNPVSNPKFEKAIQDLVKLISGSESIEKYVERNFNAMLGKR